MDSKEYEDAINNPRITKVGDTTPLETRIKRLEDAINDLPRRIAEEIQKQQGK